VDNLLISARIELVLTGSWEGTQPGRPTQTSQMGCSISCDFMLTISLGELGREEESLLRSELGIRQ